MRLLPREEQFYKLFLQQADYICQAAALLNDAVIHDGPRLETAAKEIYGLEHAGDKVIHEILKKLNSTFITPLDPEDIHNLSSKLDDILDGIEETVHRVSAYQVHPIPPPMAELTGLVFKSAQVIKKAFEALQTGSPMLEDCIEINRLENEGDRIGRAAVERLFLEETDPVVIIKLKEIYDCVEDTIDRCEDVADGLQNVAVKNS
jgi:predicted phosphate transport protein (TIGR00153 family)